MTPRLLILGVLLSVGLQAHADDQTFRTIDVPEAIVTRCIDPSAGGDIVGRYDSVDRLIHSYLLRAGERSSGNDFTSIDFPGAVATGMGGINGCRDISGWYRNTDGQTRGYLRHERQFSLIDFPSANFTQPAKINDSGDIVGWYDGVDGGHHGFLLSQDRFFSIDRTDAVATR